MSLEKGLTIIAFSAVTLGVAGCYPSRVSYYDGYFPRPVRVYQPVYVPRPVFVPRHTPPRFSPPRHAPRHVPHAPRVAPRPVRRR